jgi:hypothetical protein
VRSPQNTGARRRRIAPALLVRESVSLIHLSNQRQSHSMAKLQVHPKPPIQPKGFVLRCGSDRSFCFLLLILCVYFPLPNCGHPNIAPVYLRSDAARSAIVLPASMAEWSLPVAGG